MFAEDAPSKMSLLKIMLSIPESFESKKLFPETKVDINATYTLKGLITYTSSHYLSYFRRIPIVQTPPASNKILTECSHESEWTCFKDTYLMNVGTWEQVIYRHLNEYGGCV